MILEAELATLVACYPAAAAHERPDHSAIVVVPGLPLGLGWSQPSTEVRFVAPPPYPAAQPDCFYTDGQLRLADGGMPANTALAELNGDQLLWFSWHLTGWHPHRNDLVSYVRFIERRLHDAR